MADSGTPKSQRTPKFVAAPKPWRPEPRRAEVQVFWKASTSEHEEINHQKGGGASTSATFVSFPNSGDKEARKGGGTKRWVGWVGARGDEKAEKEGNAARRKMQDVEKGRDKGRGRRCRGHTAHSKE